MDRTERPSPDGALPRCPRTRRSLGRTVGDRLASGGRSRYRRWRSAPSRQGHDAVSSAKRARHGTPPGTGTPRRRVGSGELVVIAGMRDDWPRRRPFTRASLDQDAIGWWRARRPRPPPWVDPPHRHRPRRRGSGGEAVARRSATASPSCSPGCGGAEVSALGPMPTTRSNRLAKSWYRCSGELHMPYERRRRRNALRRQADALSVIEYLEANERGSRSTRRTGASTGSKTGSTSASTGSTSSSTRSCWQTGHPPVA